MTGRRMRREVTEIPDALEKAAATRRDALARLLGTAGSPCCSVRGSGLAVSNETAPEFTVTRRLHAGSHASAEVLNGGPVSIVGQGFPVPALAVADAAEEGMTAADDDPSATGAVVSVTSPLARRSAVVPAACAADTLTGPLALIVTPCAMVEEGARARGIDPGVPRSPRKVEESA